ncbi:hypothetical protein JB92DRAFT_2703097 [Gautieria morchelliformis]|nr:hypothetical protein JB92DRAFT_2703097 [Gautieria morchelliformis]
MISLDLESVPLVELQSHLSGISQAGDWAPYPNKTMCLIDLLDNLPRLRLSQRHMEMFLWVMKECGAIDVPSQYALRQVQARLQEACGVTTNRFISSAKHVLYVNSIPEIVAKDYANPQTAHLLQHYPEDTKGPVSEIWQATRWKELPLDLLTPMCRHKLKDYYVDELAETVTGEYVIPYMWIIREGALCCDARRASVTPKGLQVKKDLVNIRVDKLLHNYLDLKSEGPIMFASYLERIPNPLRAIANGDELYTSFVFLWADDVGGNTSKLISAHKNIYLMHTNLPGQLLQQEYFIRFVTTSPEATTPEQFEAVKEVILESQKSPPRVFHAHTQRMCKFRLVLPGLPADNPQQSEEASHIGPGGNCKCRRCFVGGPAGVRESDEGYHALHKPGVPCTVEHSLTEIRRQLDKAVDGSLAPVSSMQTASGTKDRVTQGWILKIIAKVKELKKSDPGRSFESVRAETKMWLENQPHHLWSPILTIRGLDPHRDTPVEILHTVLLGSVKYIWHSLHASINDMQREQFITRLQCTDIRGLSVPPIRASYMSQNRNGLVGKHFKTLMQTMLFHVHGIVPSAMFKLINSMGKLGAVLWYHSIPNLDQYLGDLRILIANVLDAFDLVDPARILEKGKLHILAHLVEDVERFGPAIRYATEVFESFNHVFRMCSVLSNHQSPGQDIARKCASLERVKHILSSSFWLTKDGEWVQAAPQVRGIVKRHSIIQTHLGWAPPPTWSPGIMTPGPKNTRVLCLWTEICNNGDKVLFPIPPEGFTWYDAMSVIAQSGDLCHLGTWVCVDGTNDTPWLGRIRRLLLPQERTSHGCVILERFIVSDTMDPHYEMPFLTRSEHERHVTVLPKHVKFHFNAQHDCHSGECVLSGCRLRPQEREVTEHTVPVLAHADDAHFIINLHALHNASILREMLPRHLTAPTPIHVYSKAFHYQTATQLRVTQDQKRKTSAAKSKATRLENKRKRQIAQSNCIVDLSIGDDSVESDGDLEAIPEEANEWPDKEADSTIDVDARSDGEAELPAVRSRRARGVKRKKLN